MNGDARQNTIPCPDGRENTSNEEQRLLGAYSLGGGARYTDQQVGDETYRYYGNMDIPEETLQDIELANSQEETRANEDDSETRQATHLQIGICRLCVYLRARVNRVVTLRGLPRLFLVRRAFCVYWAIVVTLFIYLKLYFPLYLTSTVSRNTLEEFRHDWCLVRSLRTDWKRLLKPCEGNTAWGSSVPGFGIENQTSAEMSYISLMTIRPVGEFSRFSIQSQTADGVPRLSGGDAWRVRVRGPSVFAPTVLDHENGTYEVMFFVLEPGKYRAEVFLDYSLCNGLKEPPDHWFMVGNTRGINQAHGVLGTKSDYLQQPLWNGVPVGFEVYRSVGPLRSEEYLSYGFGNPVYCADSCNYMWDGFGRWVNGSWKPFVSDSAMNTSPRRNESMLWIYGDDDAALLYQSVIRTPLCTRVFSTCNYTFNSAYSVHNRTAELDKNILFGPDIRRILHELEQVIHRPDMDDKSVLLLNYGIHFVMFTNFSSFQKLIDNTIELLNEKVLNKEGELTIKFQGKVVWKSIVPILREKFSNPLGDSTRFLTYQRVLLFNAYATWAMCRAGILVLDVYPIMDSYPGGANTRYEPRYTGRFNKFVSKPVVQRLTRYFQDPGDVSLVL